MAWPSVPGLSEIARTMAKGTPLASAAWAIAAPSISQHRAPNCSTMRARVDS